MIGTPLTWTGCCVSSITAEMFFMNMDSKVIFTWESLFTWTSTWISFGALAQITDHRQRRRRRWHGATNSSLFMNWGQKKISNLIWSSLLFSSGQSCVQITNVSIQIILNFEIQITLRALKKSKMLDTNRYTWRHNNLINFIVTNVEPNLKVYSDLPGWEATGGGTIPT